MSHAKCSQGKLPRRRESFLWFLQEFHCVGDTPPARERFTAPNVVLPGKGLPRAGDRTNATSAASPTIGASPRGEEFSDPFTHPEWVGSTPAVTGNGRLLANGRLLYDGSPSRLEEALGRLLPEPVMERHTRVLRENFAAKPLNLGLPGKPRLERGKCRTESRLSTNEPRVYQALRMERSPKP